jgi:ubiquitin C-terminal hydrolase
LFESSSIQAKIPLKESLSIYPFVGKKVEESPPSIYHLRGVVHHVGSTAFSGHYTTCGKRSICEKSDTSGPRENEEQWMFFDDRVGTKTSVNYVTDYERNQRSCYMALYELAEAKATVETEDYTLKEALQHTTLL